MCVIFACEDEFPQPMDLESAELMNPHGAGIAWINDDKQVQFIKGINAKKIIKLIADKKINLPCIVHFRIGTCGGLSKGLTHPFKITKDTDLSLKGVGNNVLFHNGIYSDWQDKLMKVLIKKGVKIPKGAWSDSRFMAFLASWHGRDILNLFDDQKIAVLTPNGIEKYGGKWEKSEGCEVSNTYFKHTYQTNYYYSKGSPLGNNDDYDNDYYTKKEKEKMAYYGKEIEKIGDKLRALENKRKQAKKGKKQKLMNKMRKLEKRANDLCDQREDFIQNSESINYDDVDDYKSEYDYQKSESYLKGWNNNYYGY